ncbi:MAG TPA: hypothetical protein VK790_01270 [Solirubrobacteraceae bacterium]|jgi:hypothetical protein|nr:hypothetical protein [Solirubrobacteraceae bacterium]
MAVVETFPTVCGVVVFVVIVLAALVRSLTDPPREDRVTPYREGLDAANRMQRAAQNLEQQIYAEAARHTESGPKDEPK